MDKSKKPLSKAHKSKNPPSQSGPTSESKAGQKKKIASGLATIVESIFRGDTGSWILLGLLLFFLGSGGLNIIPTGSFGNITRPVNELLRACVASLGISFVLLGAYGIAKSKITFVRSVNVLILVFWTTCVAAIFANAWILENSTRTFYNWDYGFTDQKFTVTLNPEGIRRYLGQAYVLVARKMTKDVPVESDTAVVFSPVFSIDKDTQQYVSSVDIKKLTASLSIGDEVRCDVVIVPRDFDVEKMQIHCLNDVTKAGGLVYDWCHESVRVDRNTPKNLQTQYEALPVEEKAEVLKLLNPAATAGTISGGRSTSGFSQPTPTPTTTKARRTRSAARSGKAWG
jgi:hypothetical protein